MASAQTVFIIQINLKKNIEDCPELIRHIKRCLVTSALDAKDGAKRLTYVKTSSGTAKSVLERYKAVSQHEDVLVMRVFTTSPNYASSSGILDPVAAKLDIAYARKNKVREAKNLPNANNLFINKKQRARS